MTLRLENLHLDNFRCFETLDVPFEPDVTLLFAENGGGKTAILTATAMALDLLQHRHTKPLVPDAGRDARRIRDDATGQRQPVGALTIACTATVGVHASVGWKLTASPTSRRSKASLQNVSSAIEEVRQPGVRWPLLGYYGTGRYANERKSGPKTTFQDRLDGYVGCLEPSATDGPLLDWLRAETLGDLVRLQRGEAQRGFARGVLATIERAIPRLRELHFDPALDTPIATFDDDTQATWSELSDGFFVFMGLVGDIARRAVILNSVVDGADAALQAEGIVLIDEIDLHLHPRWQRVAIKGLRDAFPKLQFILSTHSPQVLSSVENRQVRKLDNGKIVDVVFVEGRDTDAILRDEMNVDDDERGKMYRHKLYALIDDGKLAEAREYVAELEGKWSDADPELIRAKGLLEERTHESDGDV
jgi:predicted ATP-binding protein involved in virulence